MKIAAVTDVIAIATATVVADNRKDVANSQKGRKCGLFQESANECADAITLCLPLLPEKITLHTVPAFFLMTKGTTIHSPLPPL